MKSLFAKLLPAYLLFTLSLYAGDKPIDSSTVADRVKIVAGAICHRVDKRQPIDVLGPDTRTRTSVKKLYCWTKILNLYDPSEITHVWYWGDIKRAEVTLPVGRSPGWRTWSSKLIQSHEYGKWHVEIFDENKNHIGSIAFFLEKP